MPTEVEREIYVAHQKRLAAIAISVSAFRNQGQPGTIAAARRFTSTIDLRVFARALNNGTYSRYLDRQTNLLCRQVSRYGCRWGTARKGLNIFFRDVAYSRFHYTELSLSQKTFTQLELPLDSYTFKGIRRDAEELLSLPKLGLPRIPSITRLKSKDSAAFQELAAKVARSRGVMRVDLDLFFWRSDQ